PPTMRREALGLSPRQKLAGDYEAQIELLGTARQDFWADRLADPGPQRLFASRRAREGTPPPSLCLDHASQEATFFDPRKRWIDGAWTVAENGDRRRLKETANVVTGHRLMSRQE